MSGGCRGETTEINGKRAAPGLGSAAAAAAEAGRRQEEAAAAAEAEAEAEERTRHKRRRCGFSDKMAGGDYLAAPAAPPT